MTPVHSQVEYFMSRMTTRQDRRVWRHHYLWRAQLLEKDYPEEYLGLADALKIALSTQKPEG